jgi:hypothetical protein
MLGPDIAFDPVTTTILAGQADADFFRSLPEDVSPSTDNNPFFFYTSRLTRTLADAAHLTLTNNSAVGTTLLVLAAAIVACVIYIGIPLVRLARTIPLATLASPVVYFSGIGLGFMLVEISQMQRLMVFLGHPVYGLGVVLFTLLLFSGIGSATVPETAARGATIGRLAALLAALIVTGMATPYVTAWANVHETPARVAVSVLLLAPPAFFMGMMFPLGLGLWRRETALLPFFWSVNGITSVLASVLGMVLSMELGIAETYAIGGVCYLVSALTLLAATRRPAPLGEPAARGQAA